jgi:hypothetical protein
MADEKSRPGRRPLPPGEARTEIVKWRVTPSERALLDELCMRFGIDRSELQRRALHLIAGQPDLMTSPSEKDVSP